MPLPRSSTRTVAAEAGLTAAPREGGVHLLAEGAAATVATLAGVVSRLAAV